MAKLLVEYNESTGMIHLANGYSLYIGMMNSGTVEERDFYKGGEAEGDNKAVSQDTFLKSLAIMQKPELIKEVT